MDLCFVNVEQLKNFKIGNELKIELVGESFDESTLKNETHYLVNGVHIIFVQTGIKQYSTKEEIKLIRKNIKAKANGIMFNKHTEN